MEDPKIFEDFFDENKIEFLDFSEKYQQEHDHLGKVAPSAYNLNDITTPDHSEYRKRWHFKNGYGISVVRGYGTYGASSGLFEVAVFSKHKDGDWHLCYETEISSDVEGHLTAKDVLEWGKKIIMLEATI